MFQKSSGMLVAFIDFSKAYDRVDREKLWSCLEGMRIKSKFLHSFRPCMRECHVV